MHKVTAATFLDYLNIVGESKSSKNELLLFRGQNDNQALIPSIARTDPKVDTSETEREMLHELKRRTSTKINGSNFDEWDWLIYAQHYGMKTRLLDWTSNPLTALWFACSNINASNKESFVYILKNAEKFLLNRSNEKSPFENRSKTRVFKPTLNNERIIAQAGWFTAHKYSNTSKQFVDLRFNIEIRESIIEIKIPKLIKPSLLENLNIFGINHQSLFPDVTGICSHINWEFFKK